MTLFADDLVYPTRPMASSASFLYIGRVSAAVMDNGIAAGVAADA